VYTHCVPLQLTVVLGRAGQGEHEVPQVATSAFDAQALVHSWYPGLHGDGVVQPAVIPPHAAVEFVRVAAQVAHIVYLEVMADEIRLWAIDASGQTFDTARITRSR